MAALAATTLAAVTIGKGILGYSAAKQAGKDAMTEAGMQQSIYNANASKEDQMAADAIARGHVDEVNQRGTNRLLVGAQRSALAASGVDINSGSSARLVGNDVALGELDAMTIRNNAAREALGYTTQGNIDRQQGQYALVAGRNKQKADNQEAFGTLLTTAGSLASQYGSWVNSNKK